MSWDVINPQGEIVATAKDAIHGWASIGGFKPTVEGLLGYHDQGWRVVPTADKSVEPLRDLLRQAARCMEQAIRIEQVYPDEPPMPVDEWSYGADQLVHEIMKALDDCNPDHCRTASECDVTGCQFGRGSSEWRQVGEVVHRFLPSIRANDEEWRYEVCTDMPLWEIPHGTKIYAGHPPATEEGKDAALNIGAVLAYTVKPSRGVYGSTIGADGSGDFAVVFLGSEEQGANAASLYVRALEQSGRRLASALIMHGESYAGRQITIVDAAAQCAALSQRYQS